MAGHAEYDVAEICRALPGTPPTKKSAGELRSNLYKRCRAYINSFLSQPNSASPRHPGGVEAKQRLAAWAKAHGPDPVVDLCVEWLVKRAEERFEEGSDED